MAEELQESEVVFEESAEDEEDAAPPDGCSVSGETRSCSNKGKRRKLKAEKENSVPVNIQARNARFRCVEVDLDGDDGEMVPPHVIIGRRVAGKVMAFSLCSGNGRTLKGRDLREVRNCILRMTGFLET